MKISLRSRRSLAAAAIAAGALALAPSAMATTNTNLSIGVTGPATIAAGQDGVWTITVTNTGTDWVMASRIIVDNLSLGRSGLTPDNPPADGWLAPGASLTYTDHGRYGAEICGPKKYVDMDVTVRLSKGTETDLSDNAATATSRSLSCHLDLGIAKSADRANLLPGETVTWTVVVTNNGSVGMRMADVAVSDPMLADMAALDAPANGWLEPGAAVTYRGTSVATAEQCGTVTNTASVTSGGFDGLMDENTTNDQASASVSVAGGACDPVVTPPQVLPATRPATTCPATRLGVAIAAPKAAVAGQLMRVTVTGINSGRNSARGARLQYRVPSGAALRGRPAGTTLSGGMLTVNLGNMSSGTVRRMNVTLMLTRTAGSRLHRASIKGGCAVAASRAAATRVAAVQNQQTPAVTG
ncbi:MAG: DUF11 domain-containing protein [Thermoleophilia bacterium]|nr:DUF11 domain-containing protein [Thermoleophilia bacterium]